MSAIILIPAILSCWIVARRSASSAFLDVWLPCLMLLPLYFSFRLPHLPPLSFTDAAALPICIALIYLYAKRWEWRWMDGVVLAFAVMSAVSEGLHTGLSMGGLQLVSAFMTCVFPYVAGRVLIEQTGNRAKFLQRFLICLCAIACISVWDFVRGVSIFQSFWHPFFHNQTISWPVQVRWGFGRIAGPYAQSILAGMMFLIGILLATGMRHFAPSWGRRRLVSFLPITVRTLVVCGLVAGLLMTQSRGPVFGAIMGVVVVQIARAYNIKRATVVVAVFIFASLFVGYNYIQEYTAGDLVKAKTLEQQNAIYRKQLLVSYSKILHDGGVLGWGIAYYPKAPDQDSIDNEYLLLAVTQGYLGLTLFILLCVGTFLTLIRMLPFATAPPDKWLLFTLLAIFSGLLLTLTTVFLGEQIYQVFFLLAGWAQALRTPAIVRLQAARKSPLPLVQVYS